jgi:hypothetical protein
MIEHHCRRVLIVKNMSDKLCNIVTVTNYLLINLHLIIVQQSRIINLLESVAEKIPQFSKSLDSLGLASSPRLHLIHIESRAYDAFQLMIKHVFLSIPLRFIPVTAHYWPPRH